jgi:hypothetical protein
MCVTAAAIGMLSEGRWFLGLDIKGLVHARVSGSCQLSDGDTTHVIIYLLLCRPFNAM